MRMQIRSQHNNKQLVKKSKITSESHKNFIKIA